MFSAPPYSGEPGTHFDGRIFKNVDPVPERGLRELIKWKTGGGAVEWNGYEHSEPGPRPPSEVTGDRLRVTFINHATTLIQTAGMNILTDPIWSERCSPIGWAGPKRAAPPGIRFEDLPRIDLVLVSHNHYDHLDLPTLKKLAEAHKPAMVAPLGNRALFEAHSIPGAIDMDWWEEIATGPLSSKDRDVKLTCVPAQHWSGRGTRDRARTLWGGFVIDTPEAGSVFFAGDTGSGSHFKTIRDRLGPPRLAILPIGAHLPRWFMKPVHLSPADAIAAHRTLNARESMGVHFGTFELADDGQFQPAEELEAEKRSAGLGERTIWTISHGEGRDIV